MIIFKKYIFPLIILFLLNNKVFAFSENTEEGIIYGELNFDNTWDSVVYLSYIPTFDDIYSMSSEMIISKAVINSLGNFIFDISFLPEEENLFRIHMIKKGDSPISLVIGGKDENHLFFLANCHSNIRISNIESRPLFKEITFNNSISNATFQMITKLAYSLDSTYSTSSSIKRQFIENKIFEQLRMIADTCSNPLISLYAIYQSKFESNYSSNLKFYKTYLKKWRDEKTSYFESFRKQLPFEPRRNLALSILLAFLFLSIGFIIGRKVRKRNKGVKNLSVQERKIFILLKQGATNQEISEEYHIGISTVKSHVSSIFTKLNLKSRKDAMNIEQK